MYRKSGGEGGTGPWKRILTWSASHPHQYGRTTLYRKSGGEGGTGPWKRILTWSGSSTIRLTIARASRCSQAEARAERALEDSSAFSL